MSGSWQRDARRGGGTRRARPCSSTWAREAQRAQASHHTIRPCRGIAFWRRTACGCRAKGDDSHQTCPISKAYGDIGNSRPVSGARHPATRAHVAYYGVESLFCGDTLFACGAGPVRRPPADAEFARQTSGLPERRRSFGHEYTLANSSSRGGEPCTPRSPLASRRPQAARAAAPCPPRGRGAATNPVLRCREPAASVGNSTGLALSDPVRVFAAIREGRTRFELIRCPGKDLGPSAVFRSPRGRALRGVHEARRDGNVEDCRSAPRAVQSPGARCRGRARSAAARRHAPAAFDGELRELACAPVAKGTHAAAAELWAPDATA